MSKLANDIPKGSLNIAETFNKAVEMQVDAKLSKAQFDLTVTGKVLSVIDKANGQYLVQIQNAKFEAYSTGGMYYEGDTVYVNIPRGDYTQQKFIVGRKTNVDGDSASKVFNFRYPFDDFIALAQLSENEEQTQILRTKDLIAGYGFHANKEIDGAAPDLSLEDPADDPNLIWRWVLPGNESLIGTTLGIQVDWQTLLGAYSPVSGKYGLRFLVLGDWSTPTEDGKNSIQIEPDIVKEFYFTSDDMYGNPYAFLDYTTQQMLIDVRRFTRLKEIRAYFWQDHKFYANDNTYIPVDSITNINLKDFHAAFGLESKDIENEKIFLYTYDDLNYGSDIYSTESRADLDTRTIHFAWVHRTGEDEFTTVNSETTLARFNANILDEDKKAHIYWYHQRKSNMNDTDGVLYVAPGTSAAELEARYANLKDEMEQRLASLDAESYTGGEEAYLKEYLRITHNYEKKLQALQELQENANATEQMRLTTLGGYDYELLPEYTDQFEISRQMDIEVYRERYKAVVVWEGSYEISDPIVFQNVNSSVAEDLTAANNEVIFRLLRTETYKDEAGVKHERLIEDNSIGNFFVYDENNQCIKNDEEVFYSDIFYYIQIWIYNYETESYVPLTTEATTEPVTVKWQFPVSDTMITTFVPIDTSDSNYSSTLIPAGQTAFNSITATTRKFKINNFWDVRYQDNIITAVITRNGKQYTCQKQLRFGQSGSTGTKYTLRIDLTNPAGYMMEAGQAFQIESTIYDQSGNKLQSPLFTFTYELLNDGACYIGSTMSSNRTYPSVWDIRSTDGYTGNAIHGYLLSNQPPVFKVSVNLHDPQYRYEISDVRGFMATTDYAIAQYYRVSCPDRVEYKSDGTIPIYDSSTFEVLELLNNKPVYPEWFMEQYQRDNHGDLTLVNATLYDYLNLESLEQKTNRLNTNTQDTEIKNDQESEAEINGTVILYRLNPYLDNNKSIRSSIAFFWDDKMQTDNATFIGFWLNGAVVYQAIAFAHNVYASSLVNSWDGQLQLDKENNAILTKMISAGTKDAANRFTGVMMGDWNEKGDTSIDPVGLYGFAHGVQTFGFKTDGTGFIGAAGRGQIKFDGNQALISDYSQDHYINLNPVKFSITEDGRIATDNGSFSQYFLYAKNKKVDTSNQDLTSVETAYGFVNAAWTNGFRADTENDYFVVDPNNGVYMSGGIVARYGIIGDCLELSGAGLTYKKNNDIIFFGQERYRDGTLVPDNVTAEKDNNFYSFDDDASQLSDVNDGIDPNLGTKRGKYIIWLGEKNAINSLPQSRPNFGVEHDGTVHMQNAEVKGDIIATSLTVQDPDDPSSFMSGAEMTSFKTKDNYLYVHISSKPKQVQSKVSGFEEVSLFNSTNGNGYLPAGLSIHRLKHTANSPGAEYAGTSFIVNSTQMGFYKRAAEINANTQQYDMLPMLEYKDGEMGLRSKLYIGYTQTNNAYSNYIDGDNAVISLGNGQIVLDGNHTENGSAKPRIVLGLFDGSGSQASITLGGFNLTGVTGQPANFAAPMTLETGIESTAQHYGVMPAANDSTTSDPVVNTEAITGITFTTYPYVAPTTSNITNLNTWSVDLSNNGFALYTNTDYTLLVPKERSSSVKSGLINWDNIQATYGSFSSLHTTTLDVQNLYITIPGTQGDPTYAYEVATKKWVTDQLSPIVAQLAQAAASAGGTANTAFNRATNHTHNLNFNKVSGSQFAEVSFTMGSIVFRGWQTGTKQVQYTGNVKIGAASAGAIDWASIGDISSAAIDSGYFKIGPLYNYAQFSSADVEGNTAAQSDPFYAKVKISDINKLIGFDDVRICRPGTETTINGINVLSPAARTDTVDVLVKLKNEMSGTIFGSLFTTFTLAKAGINIKTYNDAVHAAGYKAAANTVAWDKNVLTYPVVSSSILGTSLTTSTYTFTAAFKASTNATITAVPQYGTTALDDGKTTATLSFAANSTNATVTANVKSGNTTCATTTANLSISISSGTATATVKSGTTVVGTASQKVYSSVSVSAADGTANAHTYTSSHSVSVGSGETKYVWAKAVSSPNGETKYCRIKVTGPSSGGTCFSGDTLITKADHTQCRLDELTMTDSILSYDEITGEFKATSIKGISRYKQADHLCQLQFSDGRIITTTFSHPFLSSTGEWLSGDPIAAKEAHKIDTQVLHINDEIMTDTKSAVKIINIIDQDQLNNDIPVYNLALFEYHTYIANGLIVHNAAEKAPA